MSHNTATFGSITRNMQAGKQGTKKFVAQYGDRLVCVRYRKDAENQRQLTTVELIVDERPLHEMPQEALSEDRIVFLQVEYGEVAVGKAVKAAGGVWDSQQKVWKIPYRQARQLGLLDRIVPAVPEENAQQHEA